MSEKKTGAALNRHGSNPDRGTPPEFIEAVERRFGPIKLDLAANADNCVVDAYWGPGSKVPDSLLENWSKRGGNLWLNPPYNKLEKFAAKFAAECHGRQSFAFMLAPASIGANWFQCHIAPHCVVLELQDRITFIGEKHGFPKDLILAVAGFDLVGRAPWHWDSSKTKAYERRKAVG